MPQATVNGSQFGKLVLKLVFELQSDKFIHCQAHFSARNHETRSLAAI